MHRDVNEAVQHGILQPALDLKVTKEMEDEYFNGLLFESQIPDKTIIFEGKFKNLENLFQQL